MDIRTALLIATAAILSGCASDGSRNNGPTKLPIDARGGIWSVRPIEEVTACLVRNNLTSSFDGRALSDRDTLYRTLIVAKEPSAPDGADERVYECV